MLLKDLEQFEKEKKIWSERKREREREKQCDEEEEEEEKEEERRSHLKESRDSIRLRDRNE